MYSFMSTGCTEAAPTFLRSFVVAIAFYHFLLGLTGAEATMKSACIQGCAKEAHLTKKKLSQQDPLTTEMVKALEAFVCSADARGIDQVAAGCFLQCVYMRARFSDMQNMLDFKADEITSNGKGLCPNLLHHATYLKIGPALLCNVPVARPANTCLRPAQIDAPIGSLRLQTLPSSKEERSVVTMANHFLTAATL